MFHFITALSDGFSFDYQANSGATSAPAAASRPVSPKPSPLLAPVTIASLPLRSGT